MNALIDLGVDDQQHLTVVRDVQRHPVRHEVVHLDFVIVRRDEVISVEVPIVLTGSAEDVRREAGTVDQVLFNLPVLGRPGSFPNELEIDISDLRIGDSVRIDDLSLPEGVTTELDGEEPIVVAQLSRASLEADELEAEAATEGETGEEPAGTE